jgi:hypothetical protein
MERDSEGAMNDETGRAEALKQWHAEVAAIEDRLLRLTSEGLAGFWPPGISNNSVHALGRASGALSQAMIARGIEDEIKPRRRPSAHHALDKGG